MANQCDITGKKPQVAGGYSNRTRATQFNKTGKRKQRPNIQRKTIYIPELDKKVTINVSSKGLKIIKKKGSYKALKEAGVI